MRIYLSCHQKNYIYYLYLIINIIMTTVINILKNNSEERFLATTNNKNYPQTLKNGINSEIFKQMQISQKLSRNDFEADIKLNSLRQNFISWLFRLSKTEVTDQTKFNTISLLDKFFCDIKNEIFSDPKNFQLIAVTCFYISFKLFEKKTITISYIGKSLLYNKWSEEEIRKSEIFVLESLNYEIHSINFYSFYQFYELSIYKYFDCETIKKIDCLVNFTMKNSLLLKEFVFGLLPLEQIIIILNTVFLILQQLAGLNLGNYKGFFNEISKIAPNQGISDFEKYSCLLINYLKFTDEFLRKFANL